MIPRIIHHVWPGNDPFKKKFHTHRLSWMTNHPDWSFCFWRLDNLPATFDNKIQIVLQRSDLGVAAKSDLLRFEILRIFGGIYVDTDMECLQPLDCFVHLDFFAGYEDSGNTVCPSLIGSVPNHPIICQTINKSLQNFEQSTIQNTNKNPHHVTGVAPFSTTVKNFAQNDMVKILEKDYFYPVGWWEKHLLDQDCPMSYTKHHWSGLDQDGWAYLTIKENAHK